MKERRRRNSVAYFPMEWEKGEPEACQPPPREPRGSEADRFTVPRSGICVYFTHKA